MAKMIKKVTVSFQVTFELPDRMNINQARDFIKERLTARPRVDSDAFENIKVYLTNKEIQYGAKGKS